MPIPPGQYPIDPRNGNLTLRTFREGMASIVGHDLVIEVTQWRGTVTVPDGAGGAPHVAVELDMGSLEVREGLHGVVPLTDKDRQEIKGIIADTLKTNANPKASFKSTKVQAQGERARVDGEFTLAGRTHPLQMTAQAGGDHTVTVTATVQQTSWGIAPYKAFLGALKVRDAVEIEAKVRLPS
jgi:polyisoprenoid-binding protein YceI